MLWNWLQHKSFLNFLIEKNILKINFQKNNLKKSNNIDTIHTNNIFCALNNVSIYSNNNCKTNNDIMFNKVMHDNTISIDTVYSNNTLHKNSSCNDEEVKIFIKALDMDEILFLLSPFFKQGNENDKKHNKFNFHYDKIAKTSKLQI